MKGIEENSRRDPVDESLRNTSDVIKEALAKRGIFFGIYDTEERDISRLEPYRGQIETVGYAAIAQIAEEMPIENVDIGVFDKPQSVIPQLGIVGYAHGGQPNSRVEVDIDPESPYRRTAIGSELRRTLRHELHHDIRLKHLGPDKTLRERLVTEGLAQWYEIEGTDEEPPIYATALNSEQLELLLELARSEFDSAEHEAWSDWFFGSEEKDVPHWTGYTIGFYIVGEYIKVHSGTKPSLLYDAPAEDFFTLNVK